MSITSYAQNFEDVMLWRALAHVDKGFYIDIGAQDPVVDSVSLLFHENGWNGIHVEPVRYYADLLRQQRVGDNVIEAAVGDANELLHFFEIPGTGVSTAKASIAEEHRNRGFKVREIVVPCITLSAIFHTVAGREIHWLKVDVEGFEQQVLGSWGESTSRPWIVLVESTHPLTQIQTHEGWEHALVTLGYSPVYFDGLNRYYVSEAHPELHSAFQAPPNVFDAFSLNGTSSADFHKLLAFRFKEQLHEANHQSELQATRERETTQRQHDAQLAQAKQETAELLQSLAKRERDFDTSLLEHQRRTAIEAAELMREHRERELALSQQLSEANQEHRRLARDSLIRERDYASETTLYRQKLDEVLNAQAQRDQLFEQDLETVQQSLLRSEQSQQSFQQELEQKSRAERLRDETLQIAIADIRAELAAMHKGRKWKLTSLLFPISPRLKILSPALSGSRELPPYSFTRHSDQTSLGDTSHEQQFSASSQSGSDRMISSGSLDVVASTEITAASDMTMILDNQGTDFIVCAYLTILRRRPDPSGLAFYLGRLRAGISKVQILGELYSSEEAKASGVSLLWLRRAIRRRKLTHLPLIGFVLRLFLDVEADSIMGKRLRIIEQQAHLISEQSALRFAQLEKHIVVELTRLSHGPTPVTEHPKQQAHMSSPHVVSQTPSKQMMTRGVDRTLNQLKTIIAVKLGA